MFLIKILDKRIALLLVAAVVIGIFVLAKNQNNDDLLGRDNYKPSSNQPLELPSTITSDFPVYPNAEVLRMITKPPSEFLVGFASKDATQKVFEFLLKNARENGWQVISQKGLVFMSTKDKTTVTISISQNPGEKTAILEHVMFVQ